MEDRKGCERGKSRTNKAVPAQPEASQALGREKANLGRQDLSVILGPFWYGESWPELGQA